MAITLEQLKQLVDQCGYRYFVDPNRPVLMLGARGIHGQYQFIIKLEDDGRFMQLRTIGYMHCPADSPHIKAVLEVLGSINYRVRFVKFGWDSSDGEIVGYGDAWVVDGTPTQGQLKRMLDNFLPVIDLDSQRIAKTIESGTDPGEQKLEAPGGGLPKELRELVERLKGGGKSKREEDDLSRI
jgi:hypothetical protein